MKNYYSIVLAFIAFIILTSGSVADKTSIRDIDPIGSEGYVAFIINSEVTSPETPVDECDCGGTGYITHGDGHRTPCLCDNCQCVKSGSSGASLPSTEVSGIYVIEWTQKGCAPCIKWERNEKPILVKEGVKVDVHNISENPELVPKYGITSTPSVWVCRDSKALKKFGNVSAKSVLEYINGL
jgi:hypothetical protein